MVGPITRWRNRRAVKALLADDEFLRQLAEADEACRADLVELEAAGAGPDFGEWFAAEADPDTDGRGH